MPMQPCAETRRLERPSPAPTSGARERPRCPLLSLVLPVYNEVRGLPALLRELRAALEPVPLRWELIFVDDGSIDGSGDWLAALAEVDSRVNVVRLTRNFGHQAALQAGLAEARGDVVVVMDSDLQDDPNAITRFLDEWRNGFDVVYAIRTERKERWWKRWLFAGFYRLLHRVADVPIPLDAGNFGLIDRRVVDALNAMPEHARFYSGLRNWVGFRQTGIPVERLPRYDGQPRVSLWGLCSLAKTAIFSFSKAPVTLFYGFAACGLLITSGLLGAVLLAACHLWSAPGWLPATCGIVALATLNSLGFAMLGDYLLQIVADVRGRPAYCIDEVVRGRGRPRSSRSSDDALPTSLQIARPESGADHEAADDSNSLPVYAGANQ